MTQKFTWIDIYRELATALLAWEDRQPKLIAFLEDLRETKELTITPLHDKNRDGERFLLKEIDPFTFFGVFNRGVVEATRREILVHMKNFFNLQSQPPADFHGVPILNNIKSWFFPYQYDRAPDHIAKLWSVFRLALGNEPLENKEFQQVFDQAQSLWGVNVNLTMGLYWIRPDIFLNLDSINREYLKIKIPSKGLTADFYIRTLKKMAKRGKSFPELSYAAWLVANNLDGDKDSNVTATSGSLPPKSGTQYWLVGAYWYDVEPADQLQRFLDEGIWQNGYDDRYLDDVKSMRVNDKIAIKSSSTQRHNLPFDADGETISRMDIKAIGTIVANRGDGKTVEVEWDPDFEPKTWYFFTNRRTVWRVRTDKGYSLLKYSTKLIDFIWGNVPQDYDWFIDQWWETEDEVTEEEGGSLQPYSVDDMIAAGVFLSREELNGIVEHLRSKKALILQGSPGVGKTFIARMLAFSLMEEKDMSRMEMVQFHQSYSYDDFVRGYRPLPGKAGSFGLQDGVFYEFCRRAAEDPEREYVFIIDEINRGNLSLIFGELLMLIESDKRGKNFAVPLVYRNPDDPRFFIPANVYLVGLMNVADRSLAMVDYALRRRFAFVTLPPKYESPLFRNWLANRAMPDDLIELIVSRMGELNAAIANDPLLGENYQVGHSYFCPKGDDFSKLNRAWYERIIRTEIAPLLKEYWFDNPQKTDDAIRKLLS